MARYKLKLELELELINKSFRAHGDNVLAAANPWFCLLNQLEKQGFDVNGLQGS